MPWPPQNELSRADLAPSRTTTAGSVADSSVVGDGGCAKQLGHSTGAAYRSSRDREESLSVEEDLQHIGSGLTAQLTIDDLTERDSTEAEAYSRNERLERCLRIAMVQSAGKEATERLFVPVDEIDRIITLESVLRELQTLSLGQDEYLMRVAHQICSIQKRKSSLNGKETHTSRRRIFATLVLIQESAAIQEVIREDLYDWDLPLALDPTDRGHHRLARRDADDSLRLVSFPQKWSAYQHEAFSRCQWQLSSPCFEMQTHVGSKIKHYRLNAHSILPIIQIDGEERQGGFASISKIKLHPAHRKSTSRDQDSTPWLALKRLRFSTEAAFNAEVGPLKRLGNNKNSHIIQLLTTFEYRDEYNLVFEWADGGNLFDFWQASPQPDDPPRNDGLGKWLATQLIGLASALSLIHECEFDPLGANNSGLNSHDGRKKYGAHGDLKPENILWFKAAPKEEESPDLGTFKLSDFGLTSFHSLESRQRFLPTGISSTYRAPESDLDRHISQKYDMWSLGCVLLEHLTWYLLGSDAVNAFAKKRMQESHSTLKEDNFFSIQDPYSLQGGGAMIKRSVHEHFNVLRNLENCSDFISDILDFVQDKLLRMLPDHRCEVSEFLRFAQQVGQKCMEDEVYCTQRLKPTRHRSDTNLSTIHARLTLHSSQHQLTAISSVNRGSLQISVTSPSSNGPDMRKRLSVPPVKEDKAPQTEQDRSDREELTNAHQFSDVPSGEHAKTPGSDDKRTEANSSGESSEDSSGTSISGASLDGNRLKPGRRQQKQQPKSETSSDGSWLDKIRPFLKRARKSNRKSRLKSSTMSNPGES